MYKTIASILFAPQAAALRILKEDIAAQGYAVCKAGMRSGKNLIAAAVAENHYSLICVVGATAESDVRDFRVLFAGNDSPCPVFKTKDECKADLEAITDKSAVLFLMMEPFWSEGSMRDFKAARRCGYEILAIGSNGPAYCADWKELGGHGYSTWQLNPKVSVEHFDNERAGDPVRFQRDFCAF